MCWCDEGGKHAGGSFDRLDEYEYDTKNMILRLQKYWFNIFMHDMFMYIFINNR